MKCMFHIHTIYSGDGRITLPELARRSRAAGIDCLFITDHDTIEGARRFQERFPEFHTVVGAEIMTNAGEIIGLFLKEDVAPGQSVEATMAAIRAQGGIVALPHPHDTWRSSSLKPKVHESAFARTDVVETFNCRTFSARHDRRAAADCARHGKVGLPGIDAHFPEEIGRATFELPEAPTSQNFPWTPGNIHVKRDTFFFRGCLRLKSIWGKHSALTLPERIFTRLQRTAFRLTGGSFFSLAEVEQLAVRLAEKVRDSGYAPEVVVGIANGGLFPAFHVARALSLPFETIRITHRQIRIGNLDTDDIIGGCFLRDAIYGNEPVVLGDCPESVRGRKILLVDDDCTRGQTFRAALDLVADTAAEARTACIRVLNGAYDPDYVVRDHRGQTFKFPRFPWYKYSPEYLRYARFREKWLHPSRCNAWPE
ncbi:MAG: phosphoribosyltransferase family protein [Kiritimatiellia bacterium]|jgi:predicted metal-dependent phosphoesterase TrpH/hypoxanthine phosphoribosyltransferase